MRPGDGRAHWGRESFPGPLAGLQCYCRRLCLLWPGLRGPIQTCPDLKTGLNGRIFAKHPGVSPQALGSRLELMIASLGVDGKPFMKMSVAHELHMGRTWVA